LCSSCVALVLLLCSSCASPRSPGGFWRDCGGFTEPARGFDSTAGSIIQMKSHFRCKGSVTAGECLGGVRPSSGAAMLESNGDAIKSGASGHSVLPAPEDGRTPPTSPPPSLRDYDDQPCLRRTAPQMNTDEPRFSRPDSGLAPVSSKSLPSERILVMEKRSSDYF